MKALSKKQAQRRVVLESPEELSENLKAMVSHLVDQTGRKLFRTQILHDDITKKLHRVSVLLDFAGE